MSSGASGTPCATGGKGGGAWSKALAAAAPAAAGSNVSEYLPQAANLAIELQKL